MMMQQGIANFKFSLFLIESTLGSEYFKITLVHSEKTADSRSIVRISENHFKFQAGERN